MTTAPCQACGTPVPLGTPGDGPARFFCAPCAAELGELMGQAEKRARDDLAKVDRALDQVRAHPLARAVEMIGETFGAFRRKGIGPRR